ncbi:MAG: hypothetical protein N2110_08300 [Flavobacteriales bacterium]|nr:hypothetical protein [Flavobacteriales bacterium]MCX7769008.1 hypothetical protein [Flavobacteriales bacterium]MDW8410203.1 hypothetical protein [Flavobacteriales bacterium]
MAPAAGVKLFCSLPLFRQLWATAKNDATQTLLAFGHLNLLHAEADPSGPPNLDYASFAERKCKASSNRSRH